MATGGPKSDCDVMIVGGGTAARVIAGRLATADPSLRILVLEAGPHTKDQLLHTQPARHLLPTSTTVKFYVGNKSEHWDGRQAVVSSAACLGRWFSINFTMYTRASASDTTIGRICFPLQTETYQVAEGRPTHGYEGPLKVSYGGLFTNVGTQFLDVASAYDPERYSLEDPNSLHAINGYGRWQKWISEYNGTRSDVPHHYLYNQSHNKNLAIETGCLVRRVLFDALDVGGKLRATDAELNKFGPFFKKQWNEFFATDEHQDKPAYWLGAVSMLVGDPSTSPHRKYFFVGYMVEYPSSRGHIHITSKDDVDFPPNFTVAGWLTSSSYSTPR
ncbi:hypothetical protein PUNSTDRAFT_142940 [Punctularia strigosozonata HHB-11173 SS5]|uniref:uncharacterized protein n=1 Tax=Punctularia strigosozonata (strain HHB-11173) TaxID=741275 RepID=UPI000441642A|nr:uncharacterized protein PUNSTDRAFT_142940 [Punctularia strigosozonata HHB-11173 SS5]EIN11096.1 hypothetical protein PUNSTDRAFT_142940 [Punctularia strigosozonata HHB-11173 SS5]